MKHIKESEKKTSRIQRAVLGTIMITPRRYFDISNLLEPFMFTGKMAIVAGVIWGKMDEEGSLDCSIVAYECEKLGADQSEVLRLIEFANPDYLIPQAKEIRNNYLTEQEILLHEKALQRLRSGDELRQVLSESSTEREILQGFESDENETRTQKITGFLERIHEARKKKDSGEMIGIPTGLPGVDQITGGWQITNYIIQAGRPGMGKTTGALNSFLAAAENGFPALFISLEMSYNEIIAKLVQKKSGVTRLDMQRGLVTDSDMTKINTATEELFEMPFFIETGCYELHQIKDKIRMYSRKYGVKLVIIDYLQLVTLSGSKSTSRNYQIETISRAFKQVASESDSNLTLIALSQLNRSVESRGGSKRPMMSDLRDSGSLEQDADLISFWYRPDYYGIMEDEEGASTKGMVEMIWTKNRHNSDGLRTCKMRFDRQHDDYLGWAYSLPDQPEESSNNYNPIISPPQRNEDETIPF